jgi:D-beta-D-heptose 7-phosphate kinase/D-beta-D-heptose 1-phosphate adenosyltransferase
MNTQQLESYNILLVGDHCEDVYQYGTVDRISPEAPVPVFVPAHQETRPGMAGNVCENLERLNCNVNYLHGKTSVKTRLIDSRSKQQLIRIDQDAMSSAIKFDSEIPTVYDAIVISDYNKGTVSYELIQELRSEFVGPIFVDTKKTDLARLEGCIVKINELEHSRATSDCSHLIVTLGKQGARYQGQRYAAGSVEVADVCGAGDTFLAALTFGYLEYKDMELAIRFAIEAASVTVQHIGCYAPTLDEVLERMNDET